MLNNKKLGLIAGNGQYPLIFARTAKELGWEIVAVAIKQETEPGLKDMVDKFWWVEVGELAKLINIFKKEQVKRAVMAGQVKHIRLFDFLKLDFKAISLLKKIKDKKADTILKAVAEELAKAGIQLEDSTIFLKKFMPGEGILTKIEPTAEQWEDIKFGYKIAKQIAGLDIGQTVIVKDLAVLAIEAMEGTDETIKRGGTLGKKDSIVVKVSKPAQDFRFDIPIIGEKTIEALIQAKIKILAFSAGETLFLNLDKVITRANENEICLVGVR